MGSHGGVWILLWQKRNSVLKRTLNWTMVLKGPLAGIRDRTLREHKDMGMGQKFIDWCDKTMAFSFYALIYFLPISIALTEIFSTLALLSWFLKRGVFFYVELTRGSAKERRRTFPDTALLFLKSFKPAGSCLTVPVALFLFFNFISMLLSKHHMISAEGFFGKTLQHAFIYFNFIECINSRRRLKIFLRVFFFSATLVSTSGIYQYFIGQAIFFFIRNGGGPIGRSVYPDDHLSGINIFPGSLDRVFDRCVIS